jgi:hypothetical protein
MKYMNKDLEAPPNWEMSSLDWGVLWTVRLFQWSSLLNWRPKIFPLHAGFSSVLELRCGWAGQYGC